MSAISRRSLVTATAALPALAVPAVANVAQSPFEKTGDHPDWIAAVRLPAVGDTSRAACVARAEFIVPHPKWPLRIPDRYFAAAFGQMLPTSCTMVSPSLAAA